MLDSVRARLTLWYVGVLALVLVAFSIGVYALLARSLYTHLNEELLATVEATGTFIARAIGEGESEERALSNALDELIAPRQAAAVFDPEGRLLAEQPARGDVHVSLPPQNFIPASGAYLYNVADDRAEDDAGRIIALQRIRVDRNGKTYLIIVSQPLNVVTEELKRIRLVLYFAVLVALALAGLGGWFLARRSLQPVVQMTERARRISAENLEQRLPIANPRDELGQLAATFNDLLARLDDSFAQQRRFMADASHELRTPLSVMRTATDVTLEAQKRSEDEYREALRVIDEQARRLTRIVEDMFTLARADAGRRALHHNHFYLDHLLLETARAANVLGARKGLLIEVADFPETTYQGDEGLLRQMILNLLDNAMKYTPAGGVVRVQLDQHDSLYTISVTDTGVGIPLEARPHIFERFYRVDKARARSEATDGAGAGLGLSIARWIAEAHHGRLELLRSDETGSTFAASLPVNGIR
ncbi:MAG TPA: heavy metal sensor histidine kinase [Pyrinomonadaceae bacterium]|jgi:heavy metal sensor kinase|nr:heavy metal sensor histidine kinase [Pyrinomonadaceae bacterium]